MTIEAPDSFNKFSELVKNFDSVCFYLSTNSCNVCKTLKPKILELINTDFPKINFCYIDIEKSKEISGQLSVFSVPTIVFYFGGKETIRVSRNINLEELKSQIERTYYLFFQ